MDTVISRTRLAPVCLWFLGASALAAPPQLVGPDPLKILLLDPRVVAHADGLELRMGAAEKEAANPLIRADKPWDLYQDTLFPNLVYDASNALYKVWYMSILVDNEQIEKMTPPSRVKNAGNKGFYVSYAQSRDGLHWEKPLLGVVGYDQQDTNVVVHDVMNMGVFLDSHAADPARRFKMIHGAARIDVHVRFSPDGIRWTGPIPAKGLEVGGPYVADTHNNAFWDDQLGKYVLFTRMKTDRGRSVAIATSEDFIHWDRPKLVLKSALEEGTKRQIYSMPVIRYANGYLGFPAMYNAGSDQRTNSELAWSSDRVTWHRTLPGTHFIPHGKELEFDGGIIYVQANPLVLHDGRMRLYYGGGSAEKPKDWKGVCEIGLAYLRPDGFAGYTVSEGHRSGMLTTNPLRLTGHAVQVSADVAERGALRIEALDDSGKVVARSQWLKRSGTDMPLQWEDGPGIFDRAGRHVIFRAELSNATLYAMRGVQVPD